MKIKCYSCDQKLDLSEVPPFSKISCPVCNARIIVPKQFGNILLEEDLGTGRLAQVYRAIDITLDRELAVKVLKDDLLSPAAATTFLNEARSASAINHPNVIPIYSCGEMEEKPYITMQFMDGGSLQNKIDAHKPVDSYLLAQWFEDTVNALDSAAVHGVAHHDIKPANIFLDLDGNVKVGDFGIARVLETGKAFFDNNKVSTDVSLEMSYYMSPEKITTGRHDTAAEIYSLGATMYHVICGKPPFDSDNAEANVRARFEKSVTPPEQIQEHIDPELADLIKSMLSIYPSDRPGSYRDLKATINSIRKRLKGAASSSRASSPAKKPSEVRPMPAEPNPQPSARPQQKSSGRAIAVSADRSSAGRPEYFARKGFLYYMSRLIPLAVIIFIALLLVAHFMRKGPVYDLMKPVIDKIEETNGSKTAPSKGDPAEDAADEKGLPDKDEGGSE